MILLIMVSLLAACSKATETPPLEKTGPSATETRTITVTLKSIKAVKSPKPTQTPESVNMVLTLAATVEQAIHNDSPSPTQTPTPTPTAVSTPETRWQLDVIEVEPSVDSQNDNHQQRYVEKAWWVDNTHFIYVIVSKKIFEPEYSLEWIEYDTELDSRVVISSPLNYDGSFWERNDIEKPSGIVEFQNFFSPSGRYVIYTKRYGFVFDSDSRSELWLTDTQENVHYLITKLGFSGENIGNIEWLDEKKSVIFDVGYEGPVSLYILDITSHTLTSLAVETEFMYSVSPDRKTLAIFTLDNHALELVSLQDGTRIIVDPERGASWPSWSFDGHILYYWWSDRGEYFFERDDIRSLNLLTGEIQTVVDRPSLVRGFQEYDGEDKKPATDYYFGLDVTFSPDGKRFLVYADGFVLVTLDEMSR